MREIHLLLFHHPLHTMLSRFFLSSGVRCASGGKTAAPAPERNFLAGEVAVPTVKVLCPPRGGPEGAGSGGIGRNTCPPPAPARRIWNPRLSVSTAESSSGIWRSGSVLPASPLPCSPASIEHWFRRWSYLAAIPLPDRVCPLLECVSQSRPSRLMRR